MPTRRVKDLTDPRVQDSSNPAPSFRHPGPRLLDLMGLVVGYGSAALLMRANWTLAALPLVPYGIVALLEYAWLGLAMSGPIVVGFDRRGEAKRTWAELAWLMIGAYWIGLTLLAVPRRFRLDAWLVLVFHLAIVLIIPIVVPSTRAPIRGPTAWTHRTAIGLLATFPLAWVAYILISLSQ